VLLTGTDNSVGNIEDSGSSTDSAKASITSAPQSDATSAPDQASNASVATYRPGATTVVVTAAGKTGALSTSTAKADSKPPKSANKAGIAAGVVVGVVVLCAVVGGLFFYLRNRKRRAIEDEYHRNATNSNAAGASHMSSSAMSDSRLEPSVMMQRRQSDGSIADNQDYSRRILKVRQLRHDAPGED
jgi:cell wall integrity and stress response component